MFSFQVPEELIAQFPRKNRTDSRNLAVFRSSGKLLEGSFKENLVRFIQRGDILVFNNSKVVNARIPILNSRFQDLLIVGPFEGFQAKVLIKNLRKLKTGDTFEFSQNCWGQFIGRDGHFGVFRFYPSVREVISQVGTPPIPIYVRKGKANQQDFERYNNVYSSIEGSVAAPTAGFHFDEEALTLLDKLGAKKGFLTLHIGVGAFMPQLGVSEEYYEISQETCDLITNKDRGRIVAVGTSTIRALETWAQTGQPSGTTNLIIEHNYKFKVVEAFFTNFHMPNSSHLKIVIAFLGLELTQKAYCYALEKKFQFFSYGDCMFCCD
jgi:S-adenosylmethionine:tRNA ribosyltransferase-isomerase